MKIALDTQISFRVARLLQNAGYEVVFCQEGEQDHVFFKKNPDCDLYVSPDYDWKNLALNDGKNILHILDKDKKASPMAMASKIIAKLPNKSRRIADKELKGF